MKQESHGQAWWRGRLVLRLVALCALLAVALLAYGFVIEPARLVERDYALPLDDWPVQCDGLRLDVVGDIHTGSPHNGLDNLDRIVERLVASDSEAVLMTGDYVILSVFMGEYVPAQAIAERLKPLTARKPVYAVLGNHDWWKDGHDISARLAAVGVRMIDNRALQVAFGDCRLWLVGLGDLQEGKPDVPGAFAPVRGPAPVIALTHEPALWPRLRDRAQLTVAGHTHGLQILPWILSGNGGPGRYERGSSALKGWFHSRGRSLFVTPGIGTSIVPMRLGVPPEISRLTLRSVRPRTAE